MTLDLRALIARCNPTLRVALEQAAALCATRTHYEVEVEHLLIRLLEPPMASGSSDIPQALEHAGIRAESLLAELARNLDRLKTGNARGPAFSPSLIELLADAWTLASLNFAAESIRSGHVLLALLAVDGPARFVRESVRGLATISADDLRTNFSSILVESSETAHATAASASSGAAAPKTPALDQYTTDLTCEAREGRIDPIVGRDGEIRAMMDVLLRRRQNNPILTGEAGVGKTAVVEGLALRIASGDVPPPLEHVRLHSLDLALLQAGAGIKGEFENRLKTLLAEIKSSPKPVILFIDEAHTIIGAGNAAGQGDAANMLKPALARGELRTIAATTWAEYKRFFEKDAALTRRFQVIRVEEPGEELCEDMLRGLLPTLEEHHAVRILNEALVAAVRLSHRYLPGRQLPDKAVSLLDTACARVALSQSTAPAALEGVARRILTLEARQQTLAREQRAGASHEATLADIITELALASSDQASLEARWKQESALVSQIHTLRSSLEQPSADANLNPGVEADVSARAQLATLRADLATLQQHQPLTHPAVDREIVADVLSEWTGIPLGKMLDDEIRKVLVLETDLKRRVIGQDHALAAIAQRIQTSRASLDDPSKPVGVFLLVGPSGVGKTETALALADLLYGGESNVITINMSEFQEAHTVSTLKGAPPGYVGFGEGGRLTEAVRRQPYSVLLLDELEKAHPDVLELFFQVFDKGSMEDGEGRPIDFRNTLILMTSNAASDSITRLALRPEGAPSPEEIVAAIRPQLTQRFKPAFLGRTLIVPYLPVQDSVLDGIIRLKLGRIERRLRAMHSIAFAFTDAVVALVRERCTEVESGARNVDHLLANTVLPEISRELLARLNSADPLLSVTLDVTSGEDLLYFWNQSPLDPPAASGANDRASDFVSA